jgi:adenine-specific DNA-methyltransferase
LADNKELLNSIESALKSFNRDSLRDASLKLLDVLGYQSDKTITVPKSDPEAFLKLLEDHNRDETIDKDKALFDHWEKADVLFQLTDDELTKEGASLKTGTANTNLLQSYLFFAIQLNQQDYPRGKLIAIARQLNRVFPMPVMVLIKHGKFLSVAVINRRQNKKDGEKDVLGKATIIRDISLVAPHTGHVQILSSFALKNLPDIHNFDELHAAWEEILNVEILNKKFYDELSNWYFWAINEVSFPGEPTIQSFFEETGLNDEDKLHEAIQEHNAKNVIRLLTRFIFVWFIKEKRLIPDEIFNLDYLQKEILKDLSPYHEDGLFKTVDIQSHYYKAVLQNLFFATLNQEMGKRAFRRSGQNTNVTNLLRYESCFKNPDKFIELAEKNIPFMNGGLFECLDKPHPTKKGPKGGDVIFYEDGFSDRTDNSLKVPDYLFFGHDEDVDISAHYESKSKKYKQAAVKGLINILNSYKFTITENTPVEQDIALDPELLGKVFENLLASYNPETKMTARKQTGSFYTPREIVGYMVDESLIAYLKNEVKDWGVSEKILDEKLHELFSYDDRNPFHSNQNLQQKIIQALNNCKILDPACGSGAFPMGILQKMVHILQKVDPKNTYWKELQKENAIKEDENVFHFDDKDAREQKLIEVNEAFDQQANDPDYARKLFLIENCIYGVDLQPIATQISKLRFFISLVVDQKADKTKINFGIRPLPNLETQFVAANALVGLENQEGQSTLDNPEIKKQETELIEIRHRLFSAKAPNTKRKLRNEDQRIRGKIGELLIKNGWVSKTANQLAGWDPYDQNLSSKFFDLEWMFGIMDGFDVVIGNPPYGVSIKGQARKVIVQKLGKVPDYEIYYFFIELSRNFLNANGVLSYIIPNTYLFNVFAKNFREDLIDTWKICSLIDFTSFSLFESATVRNSVFVLKKGDLSNTIKYLPTNKENINLIDFLNQKPMQLDVSSLREFSQNWALAFKLPPSSINALARIKDNSRHLSIFFPETSQGLIAYDKYRGQSQDIIGKRAYHFSKYREGLKKWLWGGDITKYQVNWNGEEYFDYCEGIANPRNPKYFKGKRILVREITNPSIFAAITNEEFYNDPAVLIIKESNYSLEAVSLILNSRLGTFYHFNASPKATKGDFPKILVKDIKEFPIANSIENSNKDLLRIIYSLAEYSVQQDFYKSIYKSVIDGIVFQLYFFEHMQEKQLDILQFIEKDLEEVVRNRNFEKLPSSEKENIIRQLYARWTHPDSEVRNRIKLFAVRSPEILKPILESR